LIGSSGGGVVVVVDGRVEVVVDARVVVEVLVVVVTVVVVEVVEQPGTTEWVQAPVAGTQASVVQVLPSSRDFGVTEQPPLTHRAVCVHGGAQDPEAAGSSSIDPSQLSSIPSQISLAPGWTFGLPSLQSTAPQIPPSGEKPSPSASLQRGEARSPKVALYTLPPGPKLTE
jgi:hypothetical protein